jgi:hypothetical protein
VRLDNGRLAALIGEEPRTPIDVAVRETLAAMGVQTPPLRMVEEKAMR